jgi:hypothetical protein
MTLVNSIKQRTAGFISSDALTRVIEQYIKTHLTFSDLSEKWTGTEIPLYYLRLFLDGREFDAYTCNPIQAQIIPSFWKVAYPDLMTKIMRL